MTPLEKRQRVQGAALRLARLIELNPPDDIITNEINSIKRIWETPSIDDTDTSSRFQIP